MNQTMTIVRIYLQEGEHQLQSLLKRLQEVECVRGVTVFRGIAGYGESGRWHTAALLDLSLDLPLVVEFFDTPQRAAAVISDIMALIKPGHILSWDATLHHPTTKH